MKVKPTSLKASLGINHTLQGAEGVVITSSEDAKGVYYVVRLTHKKGTRSVRREDLIVRRAQKPRRKK